MFSYSFLEDMIDKVNISKNKILEGFSAGDYDEDSGNAVYFPEIHNITGINLYPNLFITKYK